MKRQLSGVALACAAALPIADAAAQAAAYPSKPIRIIVPFAAGVGPNDNLARLVGQKLNEMWGQPAVIDNRGGAGGTIGIEAGAKSAPDGHTLVMGATSTLTVAPHIYPKLAYDPLRDVAPIINIATVPYVLIVNPNVPVKSVKELVALARAKKGFLNYGSSGAGSMSHLAAELLKSATGTDIVHVAYKATPLAQIDVLSGQIDMMFNNLAGAEPHEKAGRLRVLALANSKRSAVAPHLPTVAEAGIKGFGVDPWYGIVAPGATPKDIVAKLNGAITTMLNSADVKQQFEKLGYQAIGGTPADFSATIRKDIERFGRVIKNAGIKTEG